MSRSFAITAACERIRVDESRRGEIAFTISNASAQPQMATLLVHALPPASPSWFVLQGAPERELRQGGTDQVAFSVVVPATVAPGRYGMRLDLQPSEGAACQGQTVFVVVDGPARAKAGEFASWILFLVAALVAVGGAVAAIVAKLIFIVIATTSVAAVLFVIGLIMALRKARA